MKVLNYGSLNIDHVYTLDHFPRPGETMVSKSYAKFRGGKGLNQSIALAHAGAKVYHAGKVGQDGDYLRDGLRAAGVNTDYVLQDTNGPSGHALIQVDQSGENSIILYPGTNGMNSQAEIDACLSNFSAGDYLILQNEINHIGYIIQAAKSRGMKIAINPAPMTAEVHTYPLDLIDIFVVNEVEGGDLTGETEPQRILNNMRALYPRSKIALTLGENGIRYADPDVQLSQPAVTVKEVVDTTAAGDTFLGYFIAGLTANNEIEQILELCARACALCVSRPGASPSIPKIGELEIRSG